MWQAIIKGATTALGIGASLYANRQHRKDVEESNDLQWQRTLELQKMQNLYNSPKEQMQRYAEAGLNPNLIYGGMSPVPASTASAGVTPTPQPFDANGSIATAASLYFQREQLAETKRVNDATIAATEAQTEKTKTEKESVEINNDINRIELSHRDQRLLTELENLKKQGVLTDNQVEQVKQNIGLTEQQIKTEKENTEIKRIEKEKEEKNLKALDDFIELQKKEHEARINNINASTSHTHASTQSLIAEMARKEELHVYDKKTAQQAITTGLFNIKLLEVALSDADKRQMIGTESLETQLNILKEQLIAAQTANDFDKVERVVSIINQLTQSFANVSGSVSKIAEAGADKTVNILKIPGL